MENRAVQVIGAALGLGAPDPRCQKGPDAIWALAQSRWEDEMLQRQAIVRPSSGSTDEDVLADFCRRLAVQVNESLSQEHPTVVIGGNHACAIGTWSGAAKAFSGQGPIGLIWIDAHMDAHTPESSPSGHWHGMPVAVLLGHGAASLIDIAGTGGAVRAENLCLVGVRSYEAAEKTLLNRLGVKVFSMDDIRRLGFQRVMQKAVAIVKANTAAFGVSIDLDGIDPHDAPGVGSPVVGGIAADDVLSGLLMLRKERQWKVLEIAELNPVLDVEAKTQKFVIELMKVFSEMEKAS